MMKYQFLFEFELAVSSQAELKNERVDGIITTSRALLALKGASTVNAGLTGKLRSLQCSNGKPPFTARAFLTQVA